MVGLLPAARLRREPRRGLDRHAAARVPAVPTRRSPASRLGDRAGGERQRQGQARPVQPEVRPQDRLGAVAAARLRAGADAAQGGRGQSRLRRHHPRRPRPVHLGRHAARVLPQQRQDHRPDGRVRPGAREARRPAAVRRRRRRRPPPIARRSSAALLPFLRGAVSSNRRVIGHYDGSDDALAFANSQWAGAALPDSAPAVPITSCAPASRRCTCAWKPRRRAGRAQAAASPSGWSPTARTTRKYYKAHADTASPALRDSNPSVVVDSRARAVRVRQGQARSAHHVRVLRQRHPRHGRRQRARGRRRQAGTGAAGAARRAGGRVQELPQLRRAAAQSRRSASSTGRSKKPSCSACRRSGNSAARSPSSSAAPAASAARWRCCWPSAAHTSSSRT